MPIGPRREVVAEDRSTSHSLQFAKGGDECLDGLARVADAGVGILASTSRKIDKIDSEDGGKLINVRRNIIAAVIELQTLGLRHGPGGP